MADYLMGLYPIAVVVFLFGCLVTLGRIERHTAHLTTQLEDLQDQLSRLENARRPPPPR